MLIINSNKKISIKASIKFSMYIMYLIFNTNLIKIILSINYFKNKIDKIYLIFIKKIRFVKYKN